MDCLDVAMCDKLDDISEQLTNINSLLADFPTTTLIESGMSLIIGFLAFFLFLWVIKFLINFFDSIL